MKYVMLLLWLSGMLIGLSISNISHNQSTEAAIADNGCASHQELKPTKTNIDVYKLTNL